jgi:hypothetical protein
MTRETSMKNQVSEDKERRFITKEFAKTLSGKAPSPYLRLHDPVQKMLADLSAGTRGQPLRETAYTDRMIHFWREVSLAGLPRTGRGMDECYALLFEAAFDLAEAEPDWALECLDQKSRGQWPWEILTQLAHYTVGRRISHASLVDGFAAIYAPRRERDDDWKHERCVVASGSGWFWAALLSAAGVPEDHSLWGFRCALSSASSNGWDDHERLHARLIREAPVRAEITPRIELMDHPLLRIARLKYAQGSIEQNLVVRFLNQRCIVEGFESEVDYFGSDLTLGQWSRDARVWATELLREEPETCAAMFEACGAEAIEGVRRLFRTEIGPRPEHLDATAALIRWAKRRRGFEYSAYRAQLWEFVVEIVDAALWLGWLFPAKQCKSRRRSASGRLSSTNSS